MKILLDYNLEELENLMVSYNLPKYRAKQLLDGMMQGKIISEITTIPKDVRFKLLENFIAHPLFLMTTRMSKDGTIKFLFKLTDDNLIESVLMKYKYGYTLCVSTQVGCRMHCSFCASGIDGLCRNLSAGEILAQIVEVNKFLEGGIKENRKITNVVLMGSGEPLDNYQNVVKFLKLANEEMGISDRNISLSTCGLVPQIRKLANEDLKITLTISLHASNDKLRKELMPIAKAYSIKEIMNASKYYFNKTKRRVVFEYIVIKGVNDSDINAYELKNLMKKFSYHINLIPFNNISEEEEEELNSEDDLDLEKDDIILERARQVAIDFSKKLMSLGMSCTVRRTMGEDIEGACGQLKRKYLEKQ